MICTVQPAIAETRTRTSRKPNSVSTGSAIAATRAARPGSTTSCLSWANLLASGRRSNSIFSNGIALFVGLY